MDNFDQIEFYPVSEDEFVEVSVPLPDIGGN